MIVWLCEGCIKARGGPERIGEEVTAGRLFGACSDCGAAWCLWCRTPEESKRRPHRSCPMSGARVVASSSLRPFRLPDVQHDAPTVPDLDAAARAAAHAPPCGKGCTAYGFRGPGAVCWAKCVRPAGHLGALTGCACAEHLDGATPAAER